MLLVEKNCTLLPQTVLEFLAVLHEKIKTNIHLISINAFKNLFYILPLSVKIVMNLCLLSSKHKTACQILTTTRSQVTQVVFFFHLSITFRHVSLINTEALNSKQFWICVKFSLVWPLKVDETVHVYLTLNKLHNFSLSGSLNGWITKQSIKHLQYWR